MSRFFCKLLNKLIKMFKFSIIDLHDIVMRFNHAPTDGYETDVGKKSTIRVVNSQVTIPSY